MTAFSHFLLRRWFFALLALLVLSSPAAAHTRSETHSSWVINGSTVRVTFTIPLIEVHRLAKQGLDPSEAELGAYVQQHLGVSASGVPCALHGDARPLGAKAEYRRFDLTFVCPSGKEMKFTSDAFFDIVPTHIDFAQIQTADGNFVEQLMTDDARTIELGGEHGDLENASFFRYVGMGVMHIFTGLDHQLFLVGLILLSRRLKDLVFVITGFTIGHSVTLALAVTGLLRPHAEYIDALIGLTIVLVGCENVSSTAHRPTIMAAAVAGLLLVMAGLNLLGFVSLPTLLLVGGALFAANYLMVSGHLRDAARLRLVVTLVFGLIHGFGFAANLLEMQLPKQRLAELLVGFNLGVETGQLTLVLAVTGLTALLVRMKLALPRRLVADFGAAFLIAIGLYWFVSRGYVVGGGAHMG